ncbi:MAG: helix-turn-helix transcriptional regulator [Acidimicrobiales bacterium]
MIPPTPPPPAPATTWPFVGRGELVAAVRAALGGRGAVLVGPAGVGKSALAAAAVPRAAGRIVASPVGQELPLWGVRSLVPEATDEHEAATRLAAVLRAAHGPTGRPVLLVDDLDLLDGPSLAVVLRLLAGDELRLVATRRPGPPGPGVDTLWREAGLARIDVGPLGEDDVAELLREALGATVDGRTVQLLWRHCRGNAGVLRDAVDASIASGVLVAARGMWRLTGPVEIGTAERERASSLVEGCSAEGRGAVEVLSLAVELPLAAARRVVPAATLEALQRAGLVEVGPAPEQAVRVADPALAATVATDLPTLARARCARELREALAGACADGLAASPEVELRSLAWAVDAGEPLGADQLLDAAHLAVDAGDTALGERFARLAAAAGGGTPALLLQSWCANEQGALGWDRELFAGHEPEDDAAAVAIAIRQAEQEVWIGADPEAARATMDDARRRVGADARLALDAQDAMFLVLDGRTEDALALALPLADHPEPTVLSPASLAAGVALALLDRTAESRAVSERALERLAGPTPALFIDPGVHLVGLLFAQLLAGELLAADELATAAYRHTLGRPGRREQGWAGMLRGLARTAIGDPRDAVELGLEAELVWVAAGVEGTARWSATIAALAAAEQGDAEGLAECLARADALAAAPFRLFDAELLRARAWAVELSGEGPVAAFLAAAALGIRGGRPVHAAATAHDLVRAGHPGAALDVLAELPPGGPVTEARRAFAEAAHREDADALEACGARFEGFGAAGWAAEARALAALASTGPRAAALARSAQDAAHRSGLATPPLRRLVDERRQQPVDALTTREAEVAALAASGLSNRAIADQLVVSLRTVENHLHRAFAKLGVTTRSELGQHL